MLTVSKFRAKWFNSTYFYITVVLGSLGIVVTESLFEWAFVDDAFFVMLWFFSSFIALFIALGTIANDCNRSFYTNIVWYSVTFFIAQGMVNTLRIHAINEHLTTLLHTPYIENTNYKGVPLADLHSIIAKVGKNSYGGELLAQEIIAMDYRVPYYCETGLEAQAEYVNRLEQAHLINGVPLKMATTFSVPSYANIKRVEYIESKDSYTGHNYSWVYDTAANIVDLENGSAFLDNTIPVSKLEKLRDIIKKYNPTESVRTIFTENLGSIELDSLYTRAITAYTKLNECYAALGKNNQECIKHTKEMSKL